MTTEHQSSPATAEMAYADLYQIAHRGDVIKKAFAKVDDGVTRAPGLLAQEVAVAVYDDVMTEVMVETAETTRRVEFLESILTDDQRAQLATMEEQWQQQ